MIPTSFEYATFQHGSSKPSNTHTQYGSLFHVINTCGFCSSISNFSRLVWEMLGFVSFSVIFQYFLFFTSHSLLFPLIPPFPRIPVIPPFPLISSTPSYSLLSLHSLVFLLIPAFSGIPSYPPFPLTPSQPNSLRVTSSMSFLGFAY